MKDNLKSDLHDELKSLQKQLDDPKVYQKPEYPQLAKRHKELVKIISLLDKEQNLKEQKKQAQALTENSEADLAVLAQSEVEHLDEEIKKAQQSLKKLLNPAEDKDDQKDCLVEIRAGVGGSEASLFASDLYRMYLRFSEKQGWKVELVTQSSSDVGGLKEIILEISGSNIYKILKFESGVHRIQRIPVTESQGRIHTSTASVAVLPKAEAGELEILSNDLRIDTYRSSGHGGQSVNTTDSAVRITHLPTNIVVTCQDEKSQFKNKDKALNVLRARLLQKQEEEREEKNTSTRQKLIGKAFRNEKIRTYNFPQDRITDHRINFSLNNLSNVLDGNLLPLIDELSKQHNQVDNDS